MHYQQYHLDFKLFSTYNKASHDVHTLHTHNSNTTSTINTGLGNVLEQKGVLDVMGHIRRKQIASLTTRDQQPGHPGTFWQRCTYVPHQSLTLSLSPSLHITISLFLYIF